jgi:hypothetical protein
MGRVKVFRLSALSVLLSCIAIPSVAQSARGTLTVTAVVQTSAAWAQGMDGKWTMIVANAPDSLANFFPQSSTKARRSHTAQRGVSKISNSASRAGISTAAINSAAERFEK